MGRKADALGPARSPRKIILRKTGRRNVSVPSTKTSDLIMAPVSAIRKGGPAPVVAHRHEGIGK